MTIDIKNNNNNNNHNNNTVFTYCENTNKTQRGRPRHTTKHINNTYYPMEVYASPQCFPLDLARR